MPIVSYIHHGTDVKVDAALKGKHREHCLCHQGCLNFKPGQPDHCQIAAALYDNCKRFHVVTPVWECPEYSA